MTNLQLSLRQLHMNGLPSALVYLRFIQVRIGALLVLQAILGAAEQPAAGRDEALADVRNAALIGNAISILLQVINDIGSYRSQSKNVRSVLQNYSTFLCILRCRVFSLSVSLLMQRT